MTQRTEILGLLELWRTFNLRQWKQNQKGIATMKPFTIHTPDATWFALTKPPPLLSRLTRIPSKDSEKIVTISRESIIAIV
jgi:hypothetical protein